MECSYAAACSIAYTVQLLVTKCSWGLQIDNMCGALSEVCGMPGVPFLQGQLLYSVENAPVESQPAGLPKPVPFYLSLHIVLALFDDP